MVQFQKGCKVCLRTHEALDPVVEPILAQSGTRRDPRGSFADCGSRPKHGVDILRCGACGVRKTHDGATNYKEFTLRRRTSQFFVEQSEQASNIRLRQRGDRHTRCPKLESMKMFLSRKAGGEWVRRWSLRLFRELLNAGDSNGAMARVHAGAGTEQRAHPVSTIAAT